MSIIWNEDNKDILISYLRNGYSRKHIAVKMNMTVDAIDGAIRRYDLQENIIHKPMTTKFVDNLDFEDLSDGKFEEAKQKAKLKWKINKSRKSKTKGKPYETALFWSDLHIPHQNNQAIKAVLKLMDDIKFDKNIITGDMMDLSCISHWNKSKHKTLEMARLKNDYIQGNALLDEMDKRLPKDAEKFFLMGNHEVWADMLLEEIPVLTGMIEPESQLFLKERGYKVSQYNQLVQIGRLFVTHGIYCGANPIKKHIDELKSNCLFAHTHTLGMRLSSSPTREIAFSGYNIGCLCDLSPEYMKNRPNAWTHGFAVGYFYPNGYFDVQLVRIVKGKFIFNGKEYDGNK